MLVRIGIVGKKMEAGRRIMGVITIAATTTIKMVILNCNNHVLFAFLWIFHVIVIVTTQAILCCPCGFYLPLFVRGARLGGWGWGFGFATYRVWGWEFAFEGFRIWGWPVLGL